ncbi:MAG: hypothetical protein ABIB98_02465 [bacterium]
MKISMLCKSILIGVFFITAFSKTAVAETVCTSNYGEGDVCFRDRDIQLDKEVRFYKNGDFEARIEDAEIGDSIEFRITVKNNGDVDVDKLKVEDDLPKYLKTKEDTEWEIKNLKAGDEYEITFKAKIEEDIDIESGNTCFVNEARVKYEGKIFDEDTAIVCVTVPSVLGVKELPVTGAQSNGFGREIALGIISLGMLILGLGLKKVV